METEPCTIAMYFQLIHLSQSTKHTEQQERTPNDEPPTLYVSQRPAKYVIEFEYD